MQIAEEESIPEESVSGGDSSYGYSEDFDAESVAGTALYGTPPLVVLSGPLHIRVTWQSLTRIR